MEGTIPVKGLPGHLCEILSKDIASERSAWTNLCPPLVGSGADSLSMSLLVSLEVGSDVGNLGAVRETRGNWVLGNSVDGHDALQVLCEEI